jgi:hypothetical protein
MIDDYAVADAKTPTTRTDFYDLPTGFMAGDYTLISFWPLAEMLVVNAANVRTADRRDLHPEEHFAVRGSRNRQAPQLNFVISGKVCGPHALLAGLHSRASSQIVRTDFTAE